ncbi:hypothetical protein WY13_02648 [Clostridium ljungdahlii]|uniref:Alpha/beta hydrolase n=2 Tax=Clostridium ljungdahlii TaxID=1538 RepID=A0A168MIR8_9CLOT|nr:hypothetical protein WY13_02648 [Clostridium ljungdahlii]
MEPVFKNREEYKRIYIDLPGMGKTKPENWIVNLNIMLDIVIDFIEKVIPNTNFLLVVESYGGYNTPEHIVLKREDELLSQLEPFDAEGSDGIQVVQS